MTVTWQGQRSNLPRYAQQGFKIKRFHSDNKGEYKSYHVSEYCAYKGIVREFSGRETLQQIGKSERFGCGARDRTLTMLFQCSTACKNWLCALVYSTLIRNCIPTVKPARKTILPVQRCSVWFQPLPYFWMPSVGSNPSCLTHRLRSCSHLCWWLSNRN